MPFCLNYITRPCTGCQNLRFATVLSPVMAGVKGRQGVMARKRFRDGTVRVGDLSKVTGLRITQVAIGTGRGFRVIALPGEEIVFWSFWRGNANRFAIRQAEELKVPVEFESDLYGQSLKYKYSYTPNEYVLGGLFFIAIAGFLQIDMDNSNVPVAFLVGFGLFQFLQAYRARAVLKSL